MSAFCYSLLKAKSCLFGLLDGMGRVLPRLFYSDRKDIIVRHFVSFVQHLIILIIASIIVVLIAQHAVKDSFSVNLNGKISVAQAVGIVNMGEEANEETLAEFSQRLGISITINLPQPVLHFINSAKVGGFLAKCLHYQLFIFLINGEVLKLPIYTDVLARMNYKAIEKPLDGGSTIQAFVFYMKDFACLNVKTGVQILPNALTSCFDDYDRTYDYYRYYGTDLIKFHQLTFSHTLNAKINYEFDFFKGIKLNVSTADDVYNAFGKPSYVSLENRQYIYLETPDAVADKSNPNVQESGFVRFTFDDNNVLVEITISHKV